MQISDCDEDVGERFRLSMRQLAAAVSVVACEDAGDRFGMSATSVTSLTMEPPALLVCVNRQTSLSSLLGIGKGFSVNLLDRTHEGVSVAFGSSALRESRFSDGDWRNSASGVPMMGEALAAIECTVDRTLDYGSHRIVVGRVRDVRLGKSGEPLIYCQGAYR